MSSITDAPRPLDEQAFGARVEPHRRELHVHCYRLLGSFEEAEDLVQEAFLHAWRRRETYEGRASVRAWLYRIATNACLDALDKRPRRPSASGEVAWLQPYPDELLEQLPDRREGPQEVALAKETVELAFIAAIQHLAPLPPTPGVWTGRSTVVQGWIDGGFGSEAFGSLRCVVTRANGQPAVAGYVRKPGDAAYEPLAIDVLRVRDGVVTEIVTFDRAVFEHFDLPATLS